MNAFLSLKEIAPLPIWPGLLARRVEGQNITMAVVELSPRSVVAAHQHHNEQLGIVITGSVSFRIGDERRELAAGDTYNIPGNTPHEVVAGEEGAVLLDVFAPVRSDWTFEAAAPQAPVWP